LIQDKASSCFAGGVAHNKHDRLSET